MAIQDAIARMQTVIEGISGIKGADQYLPESLPTTENWVVMYPGETQFVGGLPAGYMTSLYTVIIEIHTPRTTLPQAHKRIVALFDDIPAALFSDLYDTKLNSTVSTFDVITSTGLIAMNYAGIDTVGFRYTVSGIKIQTAV